MLFWMADQGRMGKKSNAGFYAYDATGKREGLWDGLAAQYPHSSDPELTTVQHRLLMAQVLEAVRALQMSGFNVSIAYTGTARTRPAAGTMLRGGATVVLEASR